MWYNVNRVITDSADVIGATPNALTDKNLYVYIVPV